MRVTEHGQRVALMAPLQREVRGVSSRFPRYQWPQCTTSSNGRRSGFVIGASGRSAG
jgi:hypothetical protein